MENDDIFSPSLGRRQILGGAGALVLLGLTRRAAAFTAPFALAGEGADIDVGDLIDPDALGTMCVLTPSQTAGPYYLNLNLVRSDITEGKPGIPTRLFLNVVRASDCTPIPNAAVDVWHCDALGLYSGVASLGTAGQTFLRGIQFTDAAGMTSFDTIYPGWYPGRTTHIHVKVRPTSTSELTSQMYFVQALNNRIAGRPPYSTKGVNPTTNAGDPLFLSETVVNVLGVSGGKLQLQLTLGVA
jgi:hypothetical protein